MSPCEILAATIGWDMAEVSECKYQRYTSPVVYAIGGRYLAVSKTKPRHADVGVEWKPHFDQFWAERAGTTVWACEEGMP
jgi:hypothetical protein